MEKSIECDNSPRSHEKTIYKCVKAEKLTRSAERFQHEPGRIYKQFRARHDGKGAAAGYFECRAHCERKPKWIVPVYLGD